MFNNHINSVNWVALPSVECSMISFIFSIVRLSRNWSELWKPHTNCSAWIQLYFNFYIALFCDYFFSSWDSHLSRIAYLYWSWYMTVTIEYNTHFGSWCSEIAFFFIYFRDAMPSIELWVFAMACRFKQTHIKWNEFLFGCCCCCCFID